MLKGMPVEAYAILRLVPRTASNQKIVLMPMEASSLIGSLGGIGAIAKEVFGEGTASSPRQRQSTPRTGPSVPSETP